MPPVQIGVELMSDLQRELEGAHPLARQGSSAVAAAIFPVITAAMLAIVYLLRLPGSSAAMAESTGGAMAIVAVAGLAAAAGHNGLVLFCVGLSTTIGVMRIGGTPHSTLVILAIAVGALVRSLGKRRVIEVDWPLVAVACFVGAYLAASPPSTVAGTVAAYGLVILPAGLVVLRMALAAGRAARNEMVWLAVGATLSIGAGLVEAYGTVTNDYASYARARVFESAIGSSNYAAALAVSPGLLLLALGLRPPRRSLLLIILSVPFLVAPVVLASRGAIVAMVCGVFVLTLRPEVSRSVARVARTGAALAVTLVIVAIAARQGWYVWQRFDVETMGGNYLSGRSRLWEFTAEQAWSHPIEGLGPGHLADALMSSFGTAYAHQFYLAALAQLGLVLGVAYLWVTRPAPIRGWSPALPAIVAIAVNSAIEPVLSTPAGALVFVGLGAAHWAFGRRLAQEGVTEYGSHDG